VSRARAKNQEYQALQLLNSVVFPEDVVSVQVTDEDLAAPLLKLDATGHEEVAIVFSRSGDGEARTLGDLLPVAVVCRVVQRMRMPGGGVQVVFQGLFRGRILQTIDADGMRVSVDEISVPDDDSPEPAVQPHRRHEQPRAAGTDRRFLPGKGHSRVERRDLFRAHL
jgi:ATP-dependent Lon protease